MVLPFLLTIASPFIAFFVLIVWLVTRRRSKRLQRWVWTIIAVPPAILVTLAVGLMTVTFISRATASAADHFDWVFRHEPPPAVTDLTSAYRDDLDGGELFLAFKAPQELVDGLLAAGKFGRFTGSDVPMPGGEIPDWWNLQRCAGPRLLRYVEPPQGWSEILLVHCPAETLIFVQARQY